MVPQDTAGDIAKRRSAVKGDREKMEEARKRYEAAQKKAAQKVK